MHRPRDNRGIVIRPPATAPGNPSFSLLTRDVTPRAYLQSNPRTPRPSQPSQSVASVLLGMGLLDKLWDETVAGPRPDNGLGKLRKHHSFSPSSSSSSSSSTPPAPAAADAPAPAPEPERAVTRSITIARAPSLSVDPDPSPRGDPYSSSVPSSPASAPDSPLATATTPKDGWRRFRPRARVSDGPEPAVGPRSPTVYDWVVISSLDR